MIPGPLFKKDIHDLLGKESYENSCVIFSEAGATCAPPRKSVNWTPHAGKVPTIATSSPVVDCSARPQNGAYRIQWKSKQKMDELIFINSGLDGQQCQKVLTQQRVQNNISDRLGLGKGR